MQSDIHSTPRKAALPPEPMPAATFEWRDEYALGHAGMDDMHREFIERVQALLRADAAGMLAALDAFEDHASRHFSGEDEAMRGTKYGAGGCHIEEHSKVIASLKDVRDALAQGNTAVVHSFARALADWFPGHAEVMDQGLARWLVQQRLGGSPVLMRSKGRGSKNGGWHSPDSSMEAVQMTRTVQ